MALPRLKPVKATLSKRPSTAIRQALADLKVAEKHRRVKVNMRSTWLRSNGQCECCLAGAVMLRRPDVRRNGAERSVYEDFVDFDPRSVAMMGDEESASELGERLAGLDHFRRGYVSTGIRAFNLPVPRRFTINRYVPDYDEDRPGFYAAMYQLADDLAEHGL